MNKEEFSDWKQSHITQEVFKVIINRIEESKEILSYQAGLDPLEDRFLAGLMKGLREVLSVTWEDTSES